MPGPGTVSKDDKNIHVNLAKLRKGGTKFEIDIDPDLAIKFKQGQKIDVKNILKGMHIFSDMKKGLLASEHQMQSLFNTTDPVKVAEIILKEGEIQLTTEYRTLLLKEKRKRILNKIHVNGIDPKTGLPHPLQRLENAFEEAKIKIDEHEPEEREVKRIIRELLPILPIKFEVRLIELKIPGNYAPKTYSTVKQFGKILQETWLDDGSWAGQVEIPAGMQEEMFDKLNSMTHGGIQSKIIEKR